MVLHVANVPKKTFPRKTDFVARYGGDGFAVILQDTGLYDGEVLAKRLLADIMSRPVIVDDGASIDISLSIGVSALHSNDNASAWVLRSDQALYQAKWAGHSGVWLAEPSV